MKKVLIIGAGISKDTNYGTGTGNLESSTIRIESIASARSDASVIVSDRDTYKWDSIREQVPRNCEPGIFKIDTCGKIASDLEKFDEIFIELVLHQIFSHGYEQSCLEFFRELKNYCLTGAKVRIFDKVWIPFIQENVNSSGFEVISCEEWGANKFKIALTPSTKSEISLDT